MANVGVDHNRRRMLIGVTGGLGAVGAAYVAVPFLGSWQPSAKTKAAGAPVDIDISKLQDGQMIRPAWRGKPVYVLKRTQAQLDELKKMTTSGGLRDPNSDVLTQQPEYAHNEFRSIKPEVLVMIGICTHLGCAPTYKSEEGSVTPDWKGGYFCPCHGSKFDTAGRVFKAVPAPTNLEVPPHYYISDTLIRVGSEKGEA